MATASSTILNIKTEGGNEVKTEKIEEEEAKYFECTLCGMKERYEYFGNNPPFTKQYKLLENCYVIEDPFLPPKQGQFIVLGSHCSKCGASVCKDQSCSIFYENNYCTRCAKNNIMMFPKKVQENINKIVIP